MEPVARGYRSGQDGLYSPCCYSSGASECRDKAAAVFWNISLIKSCTQMFKSPYFASLECLRRLQMQLCGNTFQTLAWKSIFHEPARVLLLQAFAPLPTHFKPPAAISFPHISVSVGCVYIRMKQYFISDVWYCLSSCHQCSTINCWTRSPASVFVSKCNQPAWAQKY